MVINCREYFLENPKIPHKILLEISKAMKYKKNIEKYQYPSKKLKI